MCIAKPEGQFQVLVLNAGSGLRLSEAGIKTGKFSRFAGKVIIH